MTEHNANNTARSSTGPDAARVRSLLAETSTRLGVRGALSGGAIALSLAVLLLAGRLFADVGGTFVQTIVVSLALVIVGAAVGWGRGRGAFGSAAQVLEQRAPRAQNLLVTAAELLSARTATSDSARGDELTSLVMQRAAALAGSIDVANVVPLTSRVGVFAGVAATFAALTVFAYDLVPAVTAPVRSRVAAISGRVEITRISVQVESPAYTRRAVTLLRDPTRVDALVGSRVTVTIDAGADSVIVTTRDSAQAVSRRPDGTFVFVSTASADGFIALTPRAADGREGTPRLIGITVQSDAAPRVRIVAPARDMIVPDANRSIPIGVEADDDLALGSLRLRYTKVSGSGERFTFDEGEIPLAIARGNAASWKARATLALAPLLKEPGDLVVYRAVATDSRPGSPGIESDAFIAELAAPGGVAALGFSLDPDEDRYALSQQMVILKTERLIAQRATLSPSVLAEQATQLAGEQRRVRAEFVFMMGGEFAQQVTGEDGLMELDEHEEAESEGDLAAGRMVNRGRTALLSAVRAMSRAAVALTTAELAPALAQEKFALTQLQEAFARNRFLMRALSQREQLDLTRRLTGRLDSISRGRARVPEGDVNARVASLRSVLDELVTLGTHPSTDQAREAAALVALAQRLLQTDPSAPSTQQIATQLTAASKNPGARSRVLMDSAAIGVGALLRESLRPAAPTTRSVDVRRLQAELDAALDRVQRDGRPQ